MSIEQAQVVDAIGIDPKSGEVVLTISDHLDWSDLAAHVFLLQEKINAYLAFIESGEMVKSYPNAEGRRPRIDVIMKSEIAAESEDFINRMKDVLREAGIGFRTAVLLTH